MQRSVDHDETVRSRDEPARDVVFLDTTARVELEADDLNIGLLDCRAELVWRENVRPRSEHDFHGLLLLADRNRCDAFQTPAQRHFHRGRARRSGDTAHVCAHDANTFRPSFGAPSVELRLNGFTMTGRGDAVTGCGGAAFNGEAGVTPNNMSSVVVRGDAYG